MTENELKVKINNQKKNIFIVAAGLFCMLLVLTVRLYPSNRHTFKDIWHGLIYGEDQENNTEAGLKTKEENEAVSRNNSAAQQCRWYLFAGDSNMRYIFHNLITIYTENNFTKTRKAICDVKKCQSFYHKKCDERWFDQEHLMTNDRKCVLLSLRFMHSQGELERVLEWSQLKMCGTKKSFVACKNGPSMNSISMGVAGPHPDIVILAHGVWGAKSNIRDLDCKTRFDTEKMVFEKLFLQNISAVWQTNFKIKSHPSIRNDYLKAELECQILVARDQNIALKNLWTPWFSKRVGGYHLNKDGVHQVALDYYKIIDMH